jgi:hypothetical protein
MLAVSCWSQWAVSVRWQLHAGVYILIAILIAVVGVCPKAGVGYFLGGEPGELLQLLLILRWHSSA